MDTETHQPSFLPAKMVPLNQERRKSVRSKKARKRLLIIGHGMVSQHFCEELYRLGALELYETTVLAEEDCAAYDRVNLTKLLKGATRESLQLKSPDWFSSAGITLKLGEPAVAVQREARIVKTSAGVYPYDKLVFATGSTPNVPKVEGSQARGVCTYRSAEDAVSLRRRILDCKAKDQQVVVIGAGLLGLEAAEAAQSLGAQVELIESASHPLPRQLNSSAASHLERMMLGAGLALRTGARISRITQEDSGLIVELEGDARVPAGLVIAAIGVRPRDQLARDADLACDLFGGIVVNDQLQTSDPDIYSIGECARHRGSTYGVVAPGYLMAETLALLLKGQRAKFRGTATTLRLKVPHVELTCMGESNVRDLSTRTIEREKDGALHQIVVRRGRVVGASAIGAWEDFAGVQQVVSTGRRLRASDIDRFRGGGSLLRDNTIRIDSWPDTATVCGCTGVTCGALRKASADGALSTEVLSARTGAGSVCGSCVPLLSSFTGEAPKEAPSHAPLRWLSGVALVLSLVALWATPIPFADSVQITPSWDQLWRDETLKQISGFSLLALGIAAAALGLRKRLARLKWGSFARWRTVHSAIGAATLVVFGVHTGLRLGENLDLALALSFVLTGLVGAFAGFATAHEHTFKEGRGTAIRRLTNRVHLWLTWPLPVLVVFHVVKVYFF